jgi:hypothetical protein
MTPSVIQFPVFDQKPAPEGHVSSILATRVAVGVFNATKTMCQYPHVVAHADDDARRLVILMLTEVAGRAAIDPATTVTELLDALRELVPEGHREQAGA